MLPFSITQFNNKENFAGQTLIEMLIALTIGVTLVSSAVVAVTSSLHNAQSIQYQSQATKYAQEGIEVLQQIRDSNYTAFQNYNGTYCLNKGQNALAGPVGSCISANVDTFIRSVQIQQNGCAANVSRVTVTVSWKDTNCAGGTYCENVPIATCLSTINPDGIQTP